MISSSWRVSSGLSSPARAVSGGVVSIILRFTHPEQFGVFSTPVLYLVQINRAATVDLYVAYCAELAIWAKRFGITTVAETEMAIWSFAETIKNTDTSKEAAAAARRFAGSRSAWSR